MPIDIVLDAMGSDKAPDPEIRGAILAARHLDVRVHLVGPEDVLRPRLRAALKEHDGHNGNPLEALGLQNGRKHKRKRPAVFLVQASEWISMEDKAALAVRSKRDSSMRVGLKMVREGRAVGFVTVGNTGAALATVLPTSAGKPCVLLDVGANVDCDPNNLLQFAIMGHMYAKDVLHVPNP